MWASLTVSTWWTVDWASLVYPHQNIITPWICHTCSFCCQTFCKRSLGRSPSEGMLVIISSVQRSQDDLLPQLECSPPPSGWSQPGHWSRLWQNHTSGRSYTSSAGTPGGKMYDSCHIFNKQNTLIHNCLYLAVILAISMSPWPLMEAASGRWEHQPSVSPSWVRELS